jgi:hypothetical protein
MVPTSFSRESITSDLLEAKQEAVKSLLSAHVEAPRHAAYVLTTSPEQNLVGIGIATKITKGKFTSRKCVRFYVERKLAKEVIPKENLLPSEVKGVETDVVETGRFRAFPTRRIPIQLQRRRPAQPGCSIGFQFTGSKSSFVMAGTFGALVQKNAKHCILSNNHVLANENQLPLGSPIFQPGLLDNGDPTNDQIATLTQFEALSTSSPNKVDCAIAKLLDDRFAIGRVLPRVGKLSGNQPIAAKEQMKVHKVGRTTGYTRGRIFDVNADVRVGYDLGELLFEGQILVVGEGDQFSAAGDSGSLIVDRTSKTATGLLFAGSGTHTIANHLSDVLNTIGIGLVA